MCLGIRPVAPLKYTSNSLESQMMQAILGGRAIGAVCFSDMLDQSFIAVEVGMMNISAKLILKILKGNIKVFLVNYCTG